MHVEDVDYAAFWHPTRAKGSNDIRLFFEDHAKQQNEPAKASSLAQPVARQMQGNPKCEDEGNMIITISKKQRSSEENCLNPQTRTILTEQRKFKREILLSPSMQEYFQKGLELPAIKEV